MAKVPGYFLTILGGVVIAGWFLGVPYLKSVIPGLATMKFNTALSFLFAGIGLYSLGTEKERKFISLSNCLGILILLIGLLSLIEYTFNQSIGIDELFVKDISSQGPIIISPGRMSIATAVCCMLTGMSIIFFNLKKNKLLIISIAFIIFFCLFDLTGYFYGYKQLYKISSFSSMAIHTALSFIIFSFGILVIHPPHKITNILRSDYPGVVIFRRLLIPVIAASIIMGGFVIFAEENKFFGYQIGITLIIIFIILLSIFTFWYSSNILNKTYEYLKSTNKLMTFLSTIEQFLLYENMDAVFFQKVCKDALATGDFILSSIYVFDSKIKGFNSTTYSNSDGKIEELVSTSSLEQISSIFIDDIKNGQRVILNDLSKNKIQILPKFFSLAAFPLKLKNKVYGAFLLVSDKGNYFTDDKVVLLQKATTYMSFALKQKEIEKSSAYLAAIVANSDDAIISKNLDGIITSWNAGAERIFGYSPEEIIGQSITILIPNNRLDEENFILNKIKSGERVEHFQTLRLHKNGKIINVSETISPIKDSGGKIIGASKIARDITKEKEAEGELNRSKLELQRSNQDLEQFAYVASHDLQEPLRAVAGCIQLLQKRYGGQIDEKADLYIHHAVDGSLRMQKMIDDLLTFSRVGRKSNIELVESEKAFNNAVQNLNVVINENKAQIVPGKLPRVMADSTLLTLLFQNLIANALKFHGSESPRVKIAVEENASDYIFSVKDNGIGIDPQYFKRIFTIFQRLHNKKEYPGTGIGLALCAKIVRTFGGKIWVDSKFGEGSTFFFTIPKK
jgi:PAS domain S-box-containing protein